MSEENKQTQEERTLEVINRIKEMNYSRNNQYVPEIYYYLRNPEPEEKKEFIAWVEKVAKAM